MLTNGKLIRLRKPEEEDLDIALEWFKKGDHFMAGDLPVSSIDLRDMVLNQIKAPSSYDSNTYLVIETIEGVPIGMILFHSTNWKDRNAVMDVYFLEDKAKDDYALDAFLTAIVFAFQELNLHKIRICLSEQEDNLVRIVEKIGAKREQVLRKHLYRQGKYHDVSVYGLLRMEFG